MIDSFLQKIQSVTVHSVPVTPILLLLKYSCFFFLSLPHIFSFHIYSFLQHLHTKKFSLHKPEIVQAIPHTIQCKQKNMEDFTMSDLTATNCGCNNGVESGNNNSWWIIILLLLFCGGNNNGIGGGIGGGCGGGCGFGDCSCLILILLLLCCCGNGNGNGVGGGIGGGCGCNNNCVCGCSCGSSC